MIVHPGSLQKNYFWGVFFSNRVFWFLVPGHFSHVFSIFHDWKVNQSMSRFSQHRWTLHIQTNRNVFASQWPVVLPWELRDRFLDPSGPSKTGDSLTCCTILLRKYCLAMSSCSRVPEYAAPWWSLNLPGAASQGQEVESQQENQGGDVPLPDRQSVSGVKVRPPGQF